MGVVAGAATRRHLVHLVDVASAEGNVIELERRDESGDHVATGFPPFRYAEPLQPI
jgi:hypothetical protein